MDRHRLLGFGFGVALVVSVDSHAVAQAAMAANELPFVTSTPQLFSSLRPLLFIACFIGFAQFLLLREARGLVVMGVASTCFILQAIAMPSENVMPWESHSLAPALPAATGIFKASGNLTWIWLAAVAAAVAAGGVFYAVKSGAARPAPPSASPCVTEPGLAKLSAWLRGAAVGMSASDCARDAFERIGAHVAELQALGLPEEHELVVGVTKLLDSDLRDLLARFKRVERARRLLPGAVKLGDDELVRGLEQIEQALLARRQSIATAALNDLKVQSIYLTSKHGDSL